MDIKAFGLLKTSLDAHTMGMEAIAGLLRECRYPVFIAPHSVEEAMTHIYVEKFQDEVLRWIRECNISVLGFSYRLDPNDAILLLGKLVYVLRSAGIFGSIDAQVKTVCFSGLPSACKEAEKEYSGQIVTFAGGESAEESLVRLGIPSEQIPNQIKSGCDYDKFLMDFGERIIRRGDYEALKQSSHEPYPEFGTEHDTLALRMKNRSMKHVIPIMRAHAGPYSSEVSRNDALRQFLGWCSELSASGLLDVLSLGTSQLSQSHFGEDWEGMHNGGGVPVNSEEDYAAIWQAARPMLVRTYSGTKAILHLAQIYEKAIHMAWHAFSLWWFDILDGRGANTLYENLKEHLAAIRYVAMVGKPVETNVPHHFAFRGCDDVTYILSGYLGAKVAKACGVKIFVLQNMLNTPRCTWGIQDLAKSRALLSLVRSLEDKNFHVFLQTRAGLDFFKPDIQTAKAQLAAVTAMMDDIDPYNEYSPEIIHVVSYSEALFLATPAVIQDSIKITQAALREYRNLKVHHLTFDVMNEEIYMRQTELETTAKKIIDAMEEYIPNLYSPEGLYLAFVAGWLPVPALWVSSDEFNHAKDWNTEICRGGVRLCDNGSVLSSDQRIERCAKNMDDAIYYLMQQK